MNRLLPKETPEFTRGELLLIFQRIEEKLDIMNNNMTSQHNHYDKELLILHREIEKLKNFQSRAMTVWAIFVTAVGFVLNKFL